MKRMKRLGRLLGPVTLLAGIVFVLAAAAACADAGAPGETTGWVVLVPLDYALGSTELAPLPGLVLSPDRMAVIVDEPGSATLNARLVAEGVAIALARRYGALLWVTPGDLPDELASEAGVRVVFGTGVSTLLEGSREDAYRLLERGHFVVEAHFSPVAEIARPRLGVEVAERLLADHPLTQAGSRLMKALADSVSADSIRRAIYLLDYDETMGAYRSRVAARHEMRQEVMPYIRGVLRSYVLPHGGTVHQQEFKPNLLHTPYMRRDSTYYDDSVFVNVIADIPGRKTSARYIICAHYDAVAVRQPGWLWQVDPAPGADDNASGVAGVLECARLLAGLNLDVGLTFIAFSGEELGLLGSRVYTAGLTPEDSILGVINFDMIGYGGSDPRISLVYDLKSKWLTDQLARTADSLGITTPIDQIDLSGIADSDHASFWTRGIPANMLIERLDAGASPANPNYHSFGDTLGVLDIGLAGDFVKVAAGYISRFASHQQDTLPNLTLTGGSIEFRWPDRGLVPFIAGDSLGAVVRALNAGGPMKQSEEYRLRIWQGDSTSGNLVYSATEPVEVLAGEYAELGATWPTEPGVFGGVAYTFALYPVAGGVESDLADNYVAASLSVMPRTTVLRDFHVYPNPVVDPSQAKLSFEILLPRTDFTGQLDVRIFGLDGRLIGHRVLVRDYTGSKDIAVGRNRDVPLQSLVPVGLDLPSGLYVGVAELVTTGERGGESAKFRFAVAR
jgi:hypothetical protein